MNVSPTIDNRPTLSASEISTYIPVDRLPKGWEYSLWSTQLKNYQDLWSFWSGEHFLETTGDRDEDGEDVLKYPIKVPIVNQICQIHNSILWGVARDLDYVIQPRVRPAKSMMTGAPDPAYKRLADVCEMIMEKVYEQSNASAQFTDAGLISQFLGGVYLKVSYEPDKVNSGDTDLPVYLRSIRPDFVFPIPDPQNPWELLECFIVYKINPAAAKELYGAEPSKNPPYVTMVEHWRREDYSILVDGKPISLKYADGSALLLDKAPNPFGKVPIVYIPRIREGTFYGSSVIPKIAGLVKEYNSRLADVGDQVALASRHYTFGKNMNRDPKPRTSGDVKFYDIGSKNPSLQADPDVWSIPQAQVSQSSVGFVSTLLAQIDRESAISPIAYGVDEGSQRSGATLEIRMSPTINSARQQRVNWNTGLRVVFRLVMALIINKQLLPDLAGELTSLAQLSKVQATHRWSSYIPKDEGDMVNMITQLKGSGAMSTTRAVQMQPDVEDVDAEVKLIEKEKEKPDVRPEQSGSGRQQPSPDTTPE